LYCQKIFPILESGKFIDFCPKRIKLKPIIARLYHWYYICARLMARLAAIAKDQSSQAQRKPRKGYGYSHRCTPRPGT